MRCIAIVGLIFWVICPRFTSAEPPPCDYHLHYLEYTQKHFDSADAVFLGTVLNEYIPELLTQPAVGTGYSSSMDELLAQIQAAQSSALTEGRPQRATFRILKSWTKLRGPKIDVKADLYTDDTGTHALLSKGDTYLVFAYKNDKDDTLRVPVGCASHKSMKETDSKIRTLDALTKKPGSN